MLSRGMGEPTYELLLFLVCGLVQRILYRRFFHWILGAVLWHLSHGKHGFKWERASLSNGVPNLATAFLHYSYGVCFVMVTVHLGYNRFRKTELGPGLGWGYLFGFPCEAH